MHQRLLLVDDDPLLHELVRHELDPLGLQVDGVTNLNQARRLLGEHAHAVVLLDLDLPDGHGSQLLDELHANRPEVQVIVLTASGGHELVVDCILRGAGDFVRKPPVGPRLVTAVRNALTRHRLRRKVQLLENRLAERRPFEGMLGDSPPLRAAVDLLRRAATSDVTVLITGESGTGKELAARALHEASKRKEGPFVALNCGALPETLIESELFGHEKGAFTGAHETRAGCFERAQGGTLFLDEIGELRPDLQVRLLRALQEREVQRVGGRRPLQVDVRVVAATNTDVQAQVTAGTFRGDLYYRLAVFPVELPPLRTRGQDVLLLANAYLHHFARRHGRELSGFTEQAQAILLRHPWPGNVRELTNVVERSVILTDGDRVGARVLPLELQAGPGDPVPGPPATVPTGTGESPAPPSRREDLRPFAQTERALIERALELCHWNVREVARRLALGRATIYRKIERYGLSPPGMARHPLDGPDQEPS